MKNNLIKLFAAPFIAIPALCYAVEAPNFIVILTDDLGYADVGFNGGKEIPTPHIDTIAASGATFTSAYTSYSVCGPSRAGLITGRYQQRFGFERNPQYQPGDPNMGLPKTERTFGEALKNADYRSGLIGKWHLGAHKSNHPLNRGFDYFYGHLGGGHFYFPEDLTIKDSYSTTSEDDSYHTWILRNHEPVRTAKYLTDEFSDEAIEFVERNKDNPFFLYLSYNAPHTPMQAPEEALKKFSHIENQKRRTYAAMVSVVDDGVGRLMAKLRELELDDNTVIFFLSDNGGPTRANASDNRPLRGQKSDVWEGGFRVPFAMQWPGQIRAGTVYDSPVSALDIFATVTKAAGVRPERRRPLDGVDLLPYLSGEEKGKPHKAIYLRKYDQMRYAVRYGEFKLVIPQEEQPAHLYNLAKDIGEQNNIIESAPEKADEIEKMRKQWDAELVDPTFLGLIHTEDAIKKWGKPKRW